MNEHPKIEGNLLIRASAGTGKTFALATRFIRLMLFDHVEPERIVALTFSRAAAQEIYTKLLERLWKASMDQQGVDAEREHLLKNLPDNALAQIDGLHIAWTPETFARLLRKVVAVQHLGVIATLDSFILRLVGNFPLEMGFQNAVKVLDPADENVEIDRAAKAILRRAEDGDEFAVAFRAAKKGTFSRMCARTLNDLMVREGWRKFILEHPECKAWTVDSMAAALGVRPFDGFADVSETQTAQVNEVIPDKEARQWLEKFQKHLVAVKPGENPFPGGSSITAEFARAVAQHPDQPFVVYVKKPKGEPETSVRHEYPPSVFAAAHADLCRLADAYLFRQLEVVAAKIKLFAIIEGEYDVATRRAGKLTFQDFTDAAKSNTSIDLDNLRFRFDAKLDHWALDEFQDTSEVQWSCLHELVQSAASGGSSLSRSVIAVGDLKQSIYTWRGGDDRPFEEMMTWPWFGGEHGRIEPSQTSYRYGKHIADFINSVFGSDNLKKNSPIPDARSAAVNRWLREDCWLEHKPEDDKDGKPKAQDHVKIVGVRKDAESKADDVILQALYQEITPAWEAHTAAKSGETIGILVRRNEDGTKVSEYLRKKGLPVVWEGMNAVSDVPVVQAVLNLLKLAEHPEDSFAWTFVDVLLPVREILFPTLNSAAAVSFQVSELLSHQGLARTLKDLCGTLCREKQGLDGFSRSRLRALVRLGVDYESRRAADYGVDGFARFVASSGSRESAASSNVIRVLSIHRSKGLTLDRVYVPLFENDKGSIVAPKASASLFGKGRSWVLPHLSKDVVALNAETKAVWEEQCDARLLEHLRLYYVALTRSRKTLTVIFPDDDRSNELHFRDLIVNAVGSFEKRPCESGMLLFEDGEVPAFTAAKEKSGRPGDWPHAEAEARVLRRSPSRLAHDSRAGSAGQRHLTAAALFGAGYGSSVKHGVEMHAAYQQIEWADAMTAARLPEEFRIAFQKPTPDATVWRERSYELFADGCWETGQFDRVVFAGSEGGRSATIYDFKTNARESGESEAAFAARMRGLYSPQMSAYRQALHRLTKIPLERIESRLLLEATGQSVVI